MCRENVNGTNPPDLGVFEARVPAPVAGASHTSRSRASTGSGP
jgi:hypothetical protein